MAWRTAEEHAATQRVARVDAVPLDARDAARAAAATVKISKERSPTERRTNASSRAALSATLRMSWRPSRRARVCFV
jgi:hypothetical protein